MKNFLISHSRNPVRRERASRYSQRHFSHSDERPNRSAAVTSDRLDQSTTTGKVDSIERRDTDVGLHANEALAIIMKRLIFNYRNMRGLIIPILLSASLTATGFADPPPIILSTAMFSHLNSRYTPVSELNTHTLNNRQAQIDDTLNVNSFQSRTRLRLNDLTGPLCAKVFEDLPLPVNDDDEINRSRYSPKKKNRCWT